jgi:hypothetical protein
MVRRTVGALSSRLLPGFHLPTEQLFVRADG